MEFLHIKLNNIPFIIRGTGKPLRQFIYSEDLAELLLWVLFECKEELIILSGNEEISIGKIGELIAEQFNYHNIKYDTNYSDGQFKKTADNSLLLSKKTFNFTSIKDGLSNTIKWFIKNYNNCRK